jgi:hypothetical protein
MSVAAMMGGPRGGGPSAPGPGGDGRPRGGATSASAPGATGATGGAAPASDGKALHTRTEFVILFVWIEPTPSDALRGTGDAAKP